MEIQNTQSGQAFASTTSIAPVRENAPLASELKTGSDDQGQFTNSNQREKTDDLAASEKNISQAFVQQADSSNVERKGAQLDEAVAKVESFLKVQNRDLAFSIDDETNRSVVTVKDSQSGDVIRQIPSEDVLKLAERIQELQQDVGNSVGVFINNQV